MLIRFQPFIIMVLSSLSSILAGSNCHAADRPPQAHGASPAPMHASPQAHVHNAPPVSHAPPGMPHHPGSPPRGPASFPHHNFNEHGNFHHNGNGQVNVIVNTPINVYPLYDDSYSYPEPSDEEETPQASAWASASNGQVPDDAIAYDDNGTTVYYCRANYEGQLYYGELIPNDGCYLEYQNSSLKVEDYEVQIQDS